MTAQEMADELEVSVRTIYRDMDALSMAGVPVYAQRGPGGGCALLDSYRTTLTGLTQAEVRALFMLGIPSPLADLGIGQDVRSALRKLSASLPSSRRLDEEKASQRIHLDSTGWFQVHKPEPLLTTIQQALWEDRRVRVVYRLPFDTLVERLVDPYGLVAKGSSWYLVCGQDQRIRVHRVSQLVEAELTGDRFARPGGFDLVHFWRGWCTDSETNRPRFPVTLAVAPQFIQYLSAYLGEEVHSAVHETNPDVCGGWIKLTHSFDTLEDARRRILGCGGALKVLAPRALRQTVLDFAQQTAALYED
jgi:predicted DNA-binding transcriptional regulator YafY